MEKYNGIPDAEARDCYGWLSLSPSLFLLSFLTCPFTPSFSFAFFTLFFFWEVKIQPRNTAWPNVASFCSHVSHCAPAGKLQLEHICPCGFYSRILKGQAIYVSGEVFCSENDLCNNHLRIQINPQHTFFFLEFNLLLGLQILNADKL